MTVKQKLFHSTLYISILFSIFTIVVNLITGLPVGVNLKWLFLALLSISICIYIRIRPYTDFVPFAFLSFVTVFFMPLGFINGGGGKSDFIAFAFLITIIIAYILEGRYQKIGIVLVVVTFIWLHVFEHFFPDMIPEYNRVSRFYDRLIVVPALLIISYSIIRRFAGAYNESNKRLRHYANYDMLTGLLNRWALSDSLSLRFPSAEYQGHLVFMDIDNFKLVNDKWGHQTGDEVLRQFGAILTKCFNGSQALLCRWGGDEFAIFFFDGFEKLDNTLQQAVNEFICYINAIEPLVDISIGMASIEGCGSIEDIFTKSDQLMYKQKCAKREEPMRRAK